MLRPGNYWSCNAITAPKPPYAASVSSSLPLTIVHWDNKQHTNISTELCTSLKFGLPHSNVPQQVSTHTDQETTELKQDISNDGTSGRPHQLGCPTPAAR